MLLNFMGGLLLTAAMVVNVNAVIGALDVTRGARLVVATIAGLWIGLQVSLAMAGAFGSEFALVFPLIGAMVAVPVLAVALIAWRSSTARAAMLALPMPLLIGLNTARIFGAFFVLLALDGRLGGPFPYSAGWGDVITGAIALPLALLAARHAVSRGAIWSWNAFGLLDLIAAVALGALSFNGGAGQLIFDAVGSNEIQSLPWVLIPTVLVPFYIIVHGIVFAQLRASARSGRPATVAAG
jgi:hypothetical protein